MGRLWAVLKRTQDDLESAFHQRATINIQEKIQISETVQRQYVLHRFLKVPSEDFGSASEYFGDRLEGFRAVFWCLLGVLGAS